MPKFSSEVFNKLTVSGPDALTLLDTVWDDLRAPVTSINPPGGVSVPTFNTTYVSRDFASGSTEVLFIVMQLPHKYKEGTSLYPHVHWMPSSTNTGNVLWRMEYAWVSNGSVQPSFTQHDLTVAANGVAYKQHIDSWTAISKADSKISDLITIKLYRMGASDTFTGDAMLKEFDIHYQVNTIGSREEFVK